jgi:hypothetical protein
MQQQDAAPAQDRNVMSQEIKKKIRMQTKILVCVVFIYISFLSCLLSCQYLDKKKKQAQDLHLSGLSLRGFVLPQPAQRYSFDAILYWTGDDGAAAGEREKKTGTVPAQCYSVLNWKLCGKAKMNVNMLG